MKVTSSIYFTNKMLAKTDPEITNGTVDSQGRIMPYCYTL